MFHTPILCHRLFFALRPPTELARQIASAAQWSADGKGILSPDRLHVTIDILDDFAERDAMPIRSLLAIGAGIAAESFPIVFDRAIGSTRSIALRPSAKVAGLDALRAALLKAQAAHGITERAGYRFAAHMTLGYRKGAPFSEPVAPVGWEVDAFDLILSHVGQTRHDLLGHWALHAPEDRQLALF